MGTVTQSSRRKERTIFGSELEDHSLYTLLTDGVLVRRFVMEIFEVFKDHGYSTGPVQTGSNRPYVALTVDDTKGRLQARGFVADKMVWTLTVYPETKKLGYLKPIHKRFADAGSRIMIKYYVGAVGKETEYADKTLDDFLSWVNKKKEGVKRPFIIEFDVNSELKIFSALRAFVDYGYNYGYIETSGGRTYILFDPTFAVFSDILDMLLACVEQAAVQRAGQGP
ncbi:MAG: hypothetical protein QXP93_03260 [Nitrososphaerota archaeon]